LEKAIGFGLDYGIYPIILQDISERFHEDYRLLWGSIPCGDSKKLRIAEASFVNRKPRVLKHALIFIVCQRSLLADISLDEECCIRYGDG
jgi:hypothetical protein